MTGKQCSLADLRLTFTGLGAAGMTTQGYPSEAGALCPIRDPRPFSFHGCYRSSFTGTELRLRPQVGKHVLRLIQLRVVCEGITYGTRRKPCAAPLASKYSPVMMPAGLMTLGNVDAESGGSTLVMVPLGIRRKP